MSRGFGRRPCLHLTVDGVPTTSSIQLGLSVAELVKSFDGLLIQTQRLASSLATRTEALPVVEALRQQFLDHFAAELGQLFVSTGVIIGQSIIVQSQ